MKINKILQIALLFTLMLGVQNISYSQEFCEKCECDDDTDGGEPEDVGEPDDVDYSANIKGNDGSDMNVAEDDLLGPEDTVGDLTGDVISEVPEEVLSETLASVTAADLEIPGIGEIIEGAILLGVAIYEIFNAVDMDIKAKDNALAHALRAGKYKIPLVPSFSTYADDLNSKKDTVSYAVFFKKNILKSDVRPYLVNKGRTRHFNQRYPVSQLNDHTDYSFSTFYGSIESTVSGRPDHTFEYERSIPNTINIVKGANNEFFCDFTEEWSHTIGSDALNDHEKYYQLNDVAGEQSRWVKGNWSNTRNNHSKIEVWLRSTRQRPTGPYFEWLEKIPDNIVNMEEVGDQIFLTIDNYDISRYASEKGLAIGLRIQTSNNFLQIVNGLTVQEAFPDNWDYTELNPAFTRKTDFGTAHRIRLPEFSNYYHKTKGLQPPLRPRFLYHFPVTDYLPRDTPATAALKYASRPVGEKVNLHPRIYSSGKTQYTNQTIVGAAPGKTHLRLEIPGLGDDYKKQFSHIEFAGNEDKVIVSFSNYQTAPSTGVDPYCTVNTFHNTISSNTRLNTRNILMNFECDNCDELQGVSDINTTLNFMNIDAFTGHLLIENAPFAPGEIVSVTTYYDDYTFSKKTVAIQGTNGNIIPRAYYRLTADNGYLRYNPSSTTNKLDLYRGGNDNWLVEHHAKGHYAIMHKNQKKVLGIVNGVLDLYDWDPANPDLLWYPKVVNGTNYKLINAGALAFLSQTNGVLGYGFSDGIEFTLNTAAERAPAILSTDYHTFVNRLSNTVLSASPIGDPKLETRINSDKDQENRLTYVGCLQYYIQNRATQEYLIPTRNSSLDWSSVRRSWIVTNTNNYYTFSTSQGNLIHTTSATSDVVSLSTSGTIQPTSSGAQFQFERQQFTVDPSNLLAHYKLDQNANDFTSNNYDGTPLGSLSYVNDATRQQVANFDGIDDYINIPFNFSPDHYQGMTSSVWIKTTHKPQRNSDNGLILMAPSWSLNSDYNGTVTVSALGWPQGSLSTGSFGTVGFQDSRDGEWHQLTGVISKKPNNSGYTLSMYLDGGLVNTYEANNIARLRNRYPTSLSLKGNTLIGRKPDSRTNARGKHFKGYLDDVKIWKVAMTADQVRTEYENSLVTSSVTVPSPLAKSVEGNEIPVNDELEMTLYPNPSEGLVNLAFNLAEKINVTYSIIGLDGRLILSETQQFGIGNNIWALRTDGLTSGVYFVQLDVIGTTPIRQTKRLLINK